MLEGFIERQHCPACEEKKFTTIYELPYESQVLKAYLHEFYAHQGGVELDKVAGNQFELRKCPNCGLVYQGHIPNDALMETLYEKWLNPALIYEKYQRKHGAAYYFKLIDEVASLLEYFNKIPDELHFFDFGMGWSKWCKVVQSMGINSYGAELSETRIEHAKSVGINVVTLEGFEKNNFDFINTEQVFEHLPNPLAILRILVKGLKPGGLIKISVPNGYDIERRLKANDWKAAKISANSLNPVAPLEHINCFKQHTIEKMASLVGIKSVDFSVKRRLNVPAPTTPKDKFKDLMRPAYNTIRKEEYPVGSTNLFFTNM